VAAGLVLLDGGSTWQRFLDTPGAALDRAAQVGWRNVPGAPETLALSYRAGGSQRTAVVARQWSRAGATYWICADVDGAVPPAQTIGTDARFERIEAPRFESDVPWPSAIPREGRLELDGVRRTLAVEAHLEGSGWSAFAGEGRLVGCTVLEEGHVTQFAVVEPWAASAHEAGGSGPTTPVPGTVTHVAVAVGDDVEAGAALVVLEAMKMEHTIRADVDGVVAEVHVTVGQSVDAHTVVVTLEASS
jgi:biotin carboxyl carrier protein